MINVGTRHIKNWIFVTGSIRSGTTFLADILSTPLSVDYIHEPFNVRCGMPGMEKRYQYIAETLETDTMQMLDRQFERLKQYDFALQTSYYPNDPSHLKLIKKVVGSRGPFFLRLAKANYLHRHCIVKDPTAPLVARHLHTAYQFKPVVIIRHPASLVASFERVSWWPETQKLLSQDAFVRDYLTEQDLANYNSYDHSSLTDACFHWLFTYRTLLQWANAFEWPVVTHEELCASPVETFGALYDTLGLPWSSYVERKIHRKTHGGNSPEAKQGRVQDFSRDSAQIFEMRRDSLSPSQRQTIFDITQEVALQCYSRKSFNLNAPLETSHE
ncbi:hypothetical protein CRI93_00490 [Longimonas halophila]|uniref:Sulfotransferase family protein n=2 Tax=Longimonas halophila TaxID=1469170 RepID=A0A2H3NQ90_9BACT|nr:hypothetical protein CRI93_00490 [Longimonas halophila]